MKSLRMRGNGVVEWVEVPDPVAGPGEVVVKTAVSALCGSELHTYRGPGQEEGNSGHEAAGTIVAVGEGVTGLAVGQRVGVSGVTGCGVCAFCRAGQQTYCRNRPSGFGNFHAEMIRVTAFTCLPVPDDVPWDAAVLLTGDGMGVPYHTSRRLLDASIHTVAIFGQGPIGLGNTLMESYLGREVIAIDISPSRLAFARKLGASHVLDARETDPVAEIHRLTGDLGADVCLEAIGKPETLRQCFSAVRPGGTVVVNGEQGALPISPSDDLIRRDITLFGSWFYQYAEVPEMIALYRRGLAVTDLITDRIPHAEAQMAWNKFAAGETGKVILTYES